MIKKKKALFVSVHRDGESPQEFLPEAYLTIGATRDCHIKAKVPGLPDKRFRLVERADHGYCLKIPQGLDGAVTFEGSTLPVKALIGLGLLRKKGGLYVFTLPEERECALTVAGLTLKFGYREVSARQRRLERKAAGKIPESFKKALIDRQERPFLVVLGALAVVNIIMVALLSTVEIKKVEDDPMAALSKMSTRFAKLILKPPDKPAAKPKVEPPPVKEEKPPKEETPQERKEERREEPTVAETRPMTAKREAVQAKVKTKGLLVIMAKRRTSAFSGGSEAFKKAQGFMKNLGLQASPGSVNAGEESFDDFASGVVQRMEDEAAKEVALDVQAGRGKDASDIAKERQELSLLEKEKRKRASAAGFNVREEAAVYAIVRTYVGGLKFVYNNALRKDPTLKGKVTVKIVIGPQGKVTLVERVSATLESDEVVDAIMQRIYRWKFPEIDGDKDFTIQYTFDFTPVG